MDHDSAPGHVHLVDARTPFEAQVIVAVLDGAGIRALVPGGLLNDEFASSQRLLNLQNVRVMVPGDQLDAARRALADARDAGGSLEASPPEA